MWQNNKNRINQGYVFSFYITVACNLTRATTVTAKMNWTLLVITYGLYPLLAWKYGNNKLIWATNFVPFTVQQGGTSVNLTGKFIQCRASKMSRLFRPQWRNNSLRRWHVSQFCLFLLTSMSDRFRCLLPNRDDRSTSTNLLSCVENMWSV